MLATGPLAAGAGALVTRASHAVDLNAQCNLPGRASARGSRGRLGMSPAAAGRRGRAQQLHLDDPQRILRGHDEPSQRAASGMSGSQRPKLCRHRRAAGSLRRSRLSALDVARQRTSA
jgi:hypothetical protein